MSARAFDERKVYYVVRKVDDSVSRMVEREGLMDEVKHLLVYVRSSVDKVRSLVAFAESLMVKMTSWVVLVE